MLEQIEVETKGERSVGVTKTHCERGQVAMEVRSECNGGRSSIFRGDTPKKFRGIGSLTWEGFGGWVGSLRLARPTGSSLRACEHSSSSQSPAAGPRPRISSGSYYLSYRDVANHASSILLVFYLRVFHRTILTTRVHTSTQFVPSSRISFSFFFLSSLRPTSQCDELSTKVFCNRETKYFA